MTLNEGRAKGTEIIEVKTAGGLELDILPDAGLDIGQCSYKGVNMTISWSGDTLPILSQWRSMASGDYVLGLEPTNCYISGRREERENGTLPVLKAWESITNTVN